MLRQLGLRLGFLGRILMIVFALLLAFVGLAVAITFVANERRSSGVERFPIPAQAAAIVALLDRTEASQRDHVLRAVSNEGFVVSLSTQQPVAGVAAARMPGVEWLVTQYLETLADRSVRVYLGENKSVQVVDRLLSRFNMATTKTISIQVELSDGQFAVFQVRGNSTRRVFGVPAGFWLGIIGCLIAALAIWAIVREARPLGELARSVEGFAEDGRPRSVDSQGAPEIRDLIEANNTMQDRISSLIKGRTMLLGAISHDLKTYVTRLRLRAEFIEPENQKERAVRDLDDMTDLINSALSVARGAVKPDDGKVVDLGALISDEISKRPQENIEFVKDESNGAYQVSGDQVALRSVIFNLLDNANRYASRSRVSLARRDSGIELVAEDDGPGIPLSERVAVFEPFYRLEASRNKDKGGSGLGLAITKQIVEAHGGVVDVSEATLGGARLTVFLPENDK